MTVQPLTKLTYEDYENLPDEDGKYYEIIEGELFVNAAPVPRHQRILKNLLFELELYFRAHGGGEVLPSPIGVIVNQINVVQPDLIVMVDNGAWTVGPKMIHGAPNLVIEVVSKGNRRHDEVRKKAVYENNGVDEYWIVDPESESVKIYRRETGAFARPTEISTETGGTITSPLLPGFALDVATVFRVIVKSQA